MKRTPIATQKAIVLSILNGSVTRGQAEDAANVSGYVISTWIYRHRKGLFKEAFATMAIHK